MSKAIRARTLGDAYQAYLFWEHACQMCAMDSNIEKVAYEYDEVKAYDDFVVYYKDDHFPKDCRGNHIEVDYYQVKFHVRYDGSFTLESLMDPKFINAKNQTILKNLYAAWEKHPEKCNTTRLFFCSPWSVDPNNALSKLCSPVEGELILEDLFDNKVRSNNAKIRKTMREHLGISDDEKLKQILMPFRLVVTPDIRRQLITVNNYLDAFGFRIIPAERLTTTYKELTEKWNQIGLKEFTKAVLIEQCVNEGLYIGRDERRAYVPFNIKTFSRGSYSPENERALVLDLGNSFEKRKIINDSSWDNLYRTMEAFIEAHIKKDEKYELYIDCHNTLAFVLGYLLDTKSGINIAPIQKTANGLKEWDPVLPAQRDYPLLRIDRSCIDENNQEIAIAIGFTHNILEEVKAYINENHLPIKKLINCNIEGNYGHSVIHDGTHAAIIANGISEELDQRTLDEKKSILHIFSSVPAVFMFFLGRLSRGFGRCSLYEHDFERVGESSYDLSVSLPIINEEGLL